MNTSREKLSRDEMSYEVCDFAHGLLQRGGNPLHVVQALIAGTLALAGRNWGGRNARPYQSR